MKTNVLVESVASTVAAETFATAVDSAAASDPQGHILEVVHFLASTINEYYFNISTQMKTNLFTIAKVS